MGWSHRFPMEDRSVLYQALSQRLVKDIERLSQVQRDKPGNQRLWGQKLVSEHFWYSLVNAEMQIGAEIDECLAEADELDPGQKDSFWQFCLHQWRTEKHQEEEKKEQKKAVEQQKKAKEKEERRK